MDIESALNELTSIEILCDQLKERCCKARKLLAGFHSPAPSGGNKKKLSQAEVIHITTRRRANLTRRAGSK